jgi:hypothetical protein
MRRSYETLPRVSIDFFDLIGCTSLTRCRAPKRQPTTDCAGEIQWFSDIGREGEKERDKSKQNDTASAESEARDCAPMPSKTSSDSSQYGSVTPEASAKSVTQLTCQSNVLQRRMDGILRDWEECQEADDSDSDSDTSLDTSAGSRLVSITSDSPTECGVGMSFTRHGDAPSSGGPGSSGMNGTGCGSGSRNSGNNLLGRVTRSSQAVEDGDSMDCGKFLIANDQETPKEEGTKVMLCPLKDLKGKDCTGKDLTMSEFL